MTAPLTSLDQMLLTYSRAFGMACADLELVRGFIGRDGEGSANINPSHAMYDRLNKALAQLRDLCVQITSLDRVLPPIDRLVSDISDEGLTPPIAVSRLHSLQHSLFDELHRHVYYHVEERLVGYYNDSLPFGEAVFEKFPSATEDIRAAGRCLALGQGTACVFHLMLVLELGLTALAKALEIPYAPSWESYLTQIQKKMSEKHATKSAAWKRSEAFYRDVAGDLQLVKLAWRNPTMHIVRGRAYDVADAESIYIQTRTLMQRLSSRLKEPTRRRSALVGVSAPVEAA